MKKLNEKIICAGFGGQGIMTLGKVLATAGMLKGAHVTWLPSYGAEVRGGTAHAMVRISIEPIGSPLFTEPSIAIIMNSPSLDKFQDKIEKGGLLIINTSMISENVKRKDLDVISAPLTGEALALGNVRVANMIAAGIFAVRTGVLTRDDLIAVIEEMGAGRKDIIPVNIKAVDRGIELACGK